MVQYDISVYDANQKKLCTQLDTTYATEGEQSDVSISQEMSGWKELTFDIPWVVGKEKNFRMDFLKNENTIRVIRDSDVTGTYEDWFLIREPKDAHNGKTKELTVSCEHISSELKTKNLYVYFDDTNGIDTIGNLVSKALYGSGWTQGLCDTLYEADGTTEKVRSYSCDEKTGAYNMVTGICDLFMAYPTFNGADKTVDIHAISNKTGSIEFNYGKNIDSLHRSPNSTDIVTRLYVEGDYSDLGYVGIEDVNPTGLGYIMNFDYYKETGAFTDAHQTALDTYIETAKQQKSQIETTSASMLDKETRLSELWGTGKYVLYSVSNGQATAQYLGNGAEQEDATFKEDDLVVAVKNGGEYSYVTASAGMTFGTDIVYAVKFLTPSAGQIGGKEVAIEAKETTIETLTEAKEEADSEKEKTELQNQINTTQQEINNLKNGTTESEGSYALMWEAVTTVLEIKTLDATVKSAQEDMAEAEQTFIDAMGNMLHDGYWNNSNYTVGQEESLYADAVEILKIMSRPAVTYSMSFLNLAALSDYKLEEIKLNMRVRIYDFELGINDWGFIERIVEYPLAERENTVTISTDELNIGANTFESVLNRMMEAANIIDQRNAIYERAAAISEGGTISADQLNGEIDLLKNHLASTKSGWYTDANGNIMFEAQDGQSAMMLSGSGFMVANGKDASGNWNWRTFGTGEGFTADLITAGILRAGTITILGTDQFYWDADNIYIFDPSNPDRQIRIGKYDGTNYGIGYTTDNGETWQNAIGFDGVSLSASMTETINSLGDRVTEVESKVTPDAIVQTVTESETYQNEIGGLDQRISTAESKLTPEAMETTIENSEALSEVRQTADKINWIVESGTSSSNMTLTDDALSVISEGITLTADKINLVADDINLTGNTSVNTIVSNATDELETQIQQNTDNITIIASETNKATPYISDTPPEAPIEEGKLWIDTGVDPDVWRFWRGADVSTEREYTETRVGCGKNLLNDASIVPSNTANTTVMIDGHAVRIQGTGATYRSGQVEVYLPAGTYTIKADITVASGVARITRRASTDGGRTYPSTVTDSAPSGANGYTFTVERGGEWNRISFYVTWATAEDGDVTYSNIRLYAGTDATEFVPYEDIPFLTFDNTQGQALQVEAEVGCDVTSKNMIDINSLTTTTNTNLSVTMDQLRVYTTGDGGTWRGGSTRAFVLQKGIAYTLSAQLVEYVSGDAYVAVRDASDNKIISALSLDFGTTPTTMSKTYTPDSNMTVYFTAFCSNNTVLTGDVTYREIQLEVGDEATAYESYKGLAGKDQISIVACGKNLINLDDLYLPNSNTEMAVSGDSVRVYTTGSGGTYRGARTPAFWIRKGVTYTLSATLEAYVSGNALLGLRNAGTGTFLDEATVFFGSTPGTLTKTFTPDSDEEIYFSALCTNSTVLVGDCTFSNIQMEIGSAATEYEPYRSMGGGTVTPTEPLYGLPGAEDTVEVSTDGDVTVTRRTAVLELDGTENWVRSPKNNHGYYYRLSVANIFQITTSIVPNLICSHYRTEAPGNQWGGADSCISQNYIANMRTEVLIYDANYAESDLATWKSYLAAQKTAGTPVTIVYELAAPETEALTAISPIAPENGQLNLFTDADALTATIHGSGWETVNDTSSIQDALANLDGDLASLINEVGLLNGEVGSIAQQIISPDGIKNIVFDSTEYQAMANTVEQNANELSVTQTTVTDINGRVETIEGTVRISGSNIDIGRSDSNVQLHLDNTGWSISEGGQETIYARQNRVVAPRFQTTSLIFGALAFNSSGGHFRLMKYGG